MKILNLYAGIGGNRKLWGGGRRDCSRDQTGNRRYLSGLFSK